MRPPSRHGHHHELNTTCRLLLSQNILCDVSLASDSVSAADTAEYPSYYWRYGVLEKQDKAAMCLPPISNETPSEPWLRSSEPSSRSCFLDKLKSASTPQTLLSYRLKAISAPTVPRWTLPWLHCITTPPPICCIRLVFHDSAQYINRRNFNIQFGCLNVDIERLSITLTGRVPKQAPGIFVVIMVDSETWCGSDSTVWPTSRRRNRKGTRTQTGAGHTGLSYETARLDINGLEDTVEQGRLSEGLPAPNRFWNRTRVSCNAN